MKCENKTNMKCENKTNMKCENKTNMKCENETNMKCDMQDFVCRHKKRTAPHQPLSEPDLQV